MIEYLIAACALACPLSMLAMMLLMRGHRRERSRRYGEEGSQE